jgi:hypothetical protein
VIDCGDTPTDAVARKRNDSHGFAPAAGTVPEFALKG